MCRLFNAWPKLIIVLCRLYTKFIAWDRQPTTKMNWRLQVYHNFYIIQEDIFPVQCMLVVLWYILYPYDIYSICSTPVLTTIRRTTSYCFPVSFFIHFFFVVFIQPPPTLLGISLQRMEKRLNRNKRISWVPQQFIVIHLSLSTYVSLCHRYSAIGHPRYTYILPFNLTPVVQ